MQYSSKTYASDTGLLHTTCVQKELINLRMQLNETEIERYREFGQTCAAIMEGIAKEVNPGQTEKFVEKIEDNTAGDFHVLTLVDGEEVEIRSKKDPSLSFTQHFMEIVVVPASMGEYEIVNKKPGTVIVEHKTMLKR